MSTSAEAVSTQAVSPLSTGGASARRWRRGIARCRCFDLIEVVAPDEALPAVGQHDLVPARLLGEHGDRRAGVDPIEEIAGGHGPVAQPRLLVEHGAER